MQSYSDLPEEITVDILSRLPAKTVGQCRCVSKPWRALLSQPKFVRTHLDRSRSIREESVILIYDQCSLFSASFSSAHPLVDEIIVSATRLTFADHPDSWTQVYASCDGLLLVGDDQGKKFVLNPITREIKEIPPGRFKYFDNMYGLGYDSATDDFKVVALCSYDAPGFYDPRFIKMYVCVCSLKKGAWKKVESSQYDHVVDYVDSVVTVNGYVHWIAKNAVNNKFVIVAFDLVEEKLHEVPTPTSIQSDQIVHNHLVVLDGCLCIFSAKDTDIWMMKEYGVEESWTKFTIIDHHGGGIWPLCTLGQEQVVVFDNFKRCVMYDLKQGTSKNILIDGGSDDYFIQRSFVESLISPHGSDQSHETDTLRE